MRPMRGRYASYWNAILFSNNITWQVKLIEKNSEWRWRTNISKKVCDQI